MGDANCDGSINSLDSALLLQYDAGLISSLPCQTAADVNLDGMVGSLDATLILQFTAGLLGSFSPPNEAPTPEPTPTATTVVFLTPVPTSSATATILPTRTPTVAAIPTLPPDIPVLPPGSPGAATTLQAEVACSEAEPRTGIAVLSWAPASDLGTEQRVVVTIYDFESGQFETSGPLPPNQSSLIWDRVHGQATHFWRLLTLRSYGWAPSETAIFEGPTCVADFVQ